VKNVHLLIIEDKWGCREFQLKKPVYSLGRGINCDIHIFSPYVSRYHATLVRLPEENNLPGYYYRIFDGDSKGKQSTNGIKINGLKHLFYNLKNQDKIILAPDVKVIYQAQEKTQNTYFNSVTIQQYGTTIYR
jgi:pSer/pThr/pTyr-binding forkhead associated (FHA) protein